MAIFKNTTKKSAKATESKKAREIADVDGRLEGVLKAPWLSEKALIGTEKGVYVFHVPASVTKDEIKAAVEKIYKVVPRKVNIVNLPAKRKPMRRKRGFGMRAAKSKAYVYLAKGDTIALA